MVGVAYAGPVPDTAADPRVPCPRCGEGIRPGARKCPHCRRYLDSQLAEDRRQQVQAQVDHTIGEEFLRAEVKQTAIVSAVGIFVPFIGVLLGPVGLGYALWYHQRARRLEMQALPWLRPLYGFAGAWLLTGATSVALVWWWRVTHP